MQDVYSHLCGPAFHCEGVRRRISDVGLAGNGTDRLSPSERIGTGRPGTLGIRNTNVRASRGQGTPNWRLCTFRSYLGSEGIVVGNRFYRSTPSLTPARGEGDSRKGGREIPARGEGERLVSWRALRDAAEAGC